MYATHNISISVMILLFLRCLICILLSIPTLLIHSNQAALNKAENNKVVNKLEIISDSSKDTNIVLNKIKEIKIDWSKFNIEKNDDVYEETLESVEGIKHIIKVMTYLIMTGVLCDRIGQN